jgi:hypothetical protein
LRPLSEYAMPCRKRVAHKLVVIALGTVGCGKFGYDPTMLEDEPALVDSGIDAEVATDAFSPRDGSLADRKVLDEGRRCMGVSMSAPVVTDRHGGSQPGVDVTDVCPPGQAIIGYEGRVNLNSITTVGTTQARCGQIVFDGSTCAVRVVPTSMLPERGVVGTEPYAQTCPADQVVVGVRGRSGTRVDQLSIRCASLSVSATDASRLVAGPSAELPAAGGEGGSAFEISCPSGHVVNGYGVRIDRLAKLVETIWLHCGLPEVTP